VSWTVIVPVKRLGSAKSRLRGALHPVPHHDLVLALVLDTVSAALGCAAVDEVLVVTSDPEVARQAGDAGARAVPDAPEAGLNPAFAHGAAVANHAHPPERANSAHPPEGGGGGAVSVAALAGDLPALRAIDLAAALLAATVRGYVPDAAGTGTTLLAAPAGVPLRPRFGINSAAAHAATGAVPLLGDWPSLRRDVDTAADLYEAVRMGVGRRTSALVALR
jgi:2-phospho-L-lactate guanylyltransferase